ncbi:hypothetical protein CU097_014961 [Rhizopus azygosporus]|uniref:Uncharacterized protein n=2 Tax=Rhizopus TaxID=4842 RepID=A0A367K4K7_RHIAZ|nr:hypothetical protein CU097_014961 [Rhizopus azygosporus]
MAHRKMDPRFLCSFGNSNDDSDTKFREMTCVTKLYDDKEKFMINGKAQLNEIASIYSLDVCGIRLCLIQTFDFEAVVNENFCGEKRGVCPKEDEGIPCSYFSKEDQK